MLLFIARWIINAFLLMTIAHYSGAVSISNFQSAFLAVAAISFVTSIIKPIIVFITLPINILTFGLFTLIINATLFLLVSAFVPGFEFHSFIGAMYVSIIYSIATFIIHKVLVK